MSGLVMSAAVFAACLGHLASLERIGFDGTRAAVMFWNTKQLSWSPDWLNYVFAGCSIIGLVLFGLALATAAGISWQRGLTVH